MANFSVIAATVTDPHLITTLQRVAEIMRDVDDDWCIFGGAAAAIHGVTNMAVADVDILTSPAVASQVLRSHGVMTTADGGTDRFRSQVFGTLRVAPLPIDIMAGFEVRDSNSWWPVRFATSEIVELPAGRIVVPSRSELIEVTRGFGREQDLRRAEALKRCARR
jgi:hypothetical protein